MELLNGGKEAVETKPVQVEPFHVKQHRLKGNMAMLPYAVYKDRYAGRGQG